MSLQFSENKLKKVNEIISRYPEGSKQKRLASGAAFGTGRIWELA